MLVDIYVSATKSTVFVAVPAGTPILSVALPKHPDLAGLRLFKSNVTIDKGKNLIAIDADDVLSQIAAKGFAIIGAEVSSTEI